MKRYVRRKRTKPSNGQMSLLGDVYNFNLKYIPHKVVAPTGEAIVVVRIPPDADPMDKLASLQESKRMAGTTTSHLNKDFWIKRHRDKVRADALKEIRERQLVA